MKAQTKKIIAVSVAVIVGLAAGVLFANHRGFFPGDEQAQTPHVSEAGEQTPAPAWTPPVAVPAPDAAPIAMEAVFSANEISTLATIFFDMADPESEAVSQLLDELVLTSRAAMHGIVLNEDEQAEILDVAEYLYELYAMFGVDLTHMPATRIVEIISSDLYFDKLMELYTSDVVVTEEEMLRAIADFKENNKAEYYDIQVKFAYTQELEPFEAARANVMAGTMSFDQLVEQHHVEYNPEVGVITAALWQLYLDNDENNKIVALSEGGISPIITQQVPQGEDDYVSYYLLVQLVSKTAPPEDEFDYYFREHHISNTKIERFETILDAWKAAVNYTIN
jgi:hypothetical protein